MSVIEYLTGILIQRYQDISHATPVVTLNLNWQSTNSNLKNNKKIITDQSHVNVVLTMSMIYCLFVITRSPLVVPAFGANFGLGDFDG